MKADRPWAELIHGPDGSIQCYGVMPDQLTADLANCLWFASLQLQALKRHQHCGSRSSP
jgi:hypothetical protein